MANKIDEQKFLEVVSAKILGGEEIEMDENLRDIEAWDSLSSVSFLALMDVEFDSTINPLEARSAQTVRDAYELACEGVED